jgi:hypothetical protein
VNDVISWLALPAGAGRVVTGIAAERDHVELVGGWAEGSAGAEAWRDGGGPDRLSAHVDGLGIGGARSWVVVLGGEPLGYVETSLLGDTALEEALVDAEVEAAPDDMVWVAHLGPTGSTTEATRHLIARGLLASAFLVSGVERVLVALGPDERTRLATCESVGMTEVAELEVDGVQRTVLCSDRQSFVTAWPGDMASVELSSARLSRLTG